MQWSSVQESREMGWVWQDDDDGGSRSSGSGFDINIDSGNPSWSPAGDGGTRKVVMTQCRTEESEPGMFIRKCEKTEQIFKDCVGRPSELVQSNKEYTEEDVTSQMTKGSLPLESSQPGPFLPGLRSDIEAMEGNFFSGLDRFFDAAEQTMNGVFGSFGIPRTYDGSNNTKSFPAWRRRQGVPVEEGNPSKRPSTEVSTSSNGDIDFSGLTKDV